MFRKSFYLGGISLALLVSSCQEQEEVNEDPTNMCDCFEIQLQMIGDMDGMDMNDPKVEEIEKGYEEAFELCQVIGEEFEKNVEGLSMEEMEQVRTDLLDDCPAFAEVEAYMEEQMRMMQESMQDMNPEDLDLEDLDLDEIEEMDLEGIQEEAEKSLN